jgi:hypothetical protein
VTKALDALVRASYYNAYRLDPQPQEEFGIPTGLPESRVVGPTIHLAGVVYGGSARASSYWVVADICFDTPTGCEDGGAFQVFHRTGPSGDFAYGTFDVCDIPEPLAQQWFPGGRYPMGGRCPRAAAAPRQPVLGSTAFIPRIGAGWGTYKPKEIFNGGDPSGLIYGITWSGWGRPDAYGSGKSIISYPGNLYTELRAFDLGRCTAYGPRAYEVLDVRTPLPHGGFGKWFVWDNVKTLCSPYP